MEDLKKLYDALYQSRYVTVGFDDFKKAYNSDEAYRGKVYDTVHKDGLFTLDKQTFLNTYKPEESTWQYLKNKAASVFTSEEEQPQKSSQKNQQSGLGSQSTQGKEASSSESSIGNEPKKTAVRAQGKSLGSLFENQAETFSKRQQAASPSKGPIDKAKQAKDFFKPREEFARKIATTNPSVNKSFVKDAAGNTIAYNKQTQRPVVNPMTGKVDIVTDTEKEFKAKQQPQAKIIEDSQAVKELKSYGFKYDNPNYSNITDDEQSKVVSFFDDINSLGIDASDFSRYLKNKTDFFEDETLDTTIPQRLDAIKNKYLSGYLNDRGSFLKNKVDVLKNKPEEHKAATEQLDKFNDTNFENYKKQYLPSIYQKDLELSKETKDEYDRIKNKKSSRFFYDAARGGVDLVNGFGDAFNDIITTGLDFVGADKAADYNRLDTYIRDSHKFRHQMNGEGKKVSLNGEDFYVMDNGAIVDNETGIAINGIESPDKLKKIYDLSKNVKDKQTFYDPRGYFTQAANVIGNLGGQVVLTYLTGGAASELGVASGSAKVAANIEKGAEMASVFGMTASSTYNQTLQELRDAGISDTDAKIAAMKIGTAQGVVGALTTFALPNANANKIMKSLNTNLVIKESIDVLKKEGQEGLANYLKTKAVKAALNSPEIIKEGVGEGVQELLESAAQYKASEYVNQDLGTNLQEGFRNNEILDTFILAAAAGSLAGGIGKAKEGAFGLSVKQNFDYLSEIDPTKLDGIGYKMVKNGAITEDQFKTLKDQTNNYRRYKDKILPTVKGRDAVELTQLIAERDNLKEQKKNVDEAFHPELDVKIGEVNKKINDIVSKKQESVNDLTVEDVMNIDDDQSITFTVKDESEVPEEFKDRAEKRNDLDVEGRENILGLPIGKKTTEKIGEGYTYTLTGKEIKDYAAAQQKAAMGITEQENVITPKEKDELVQRQSELQKSLDEHEADIKNGGEGILENVDEVKSELEDITKKIDEAKVAEPLQPTTKQDYEEIRNDLEKKIDEHYENIDEGGTGTVENIDELEKQLEDVNQTIDEIDIFGEATPMSIEERAPINETHDVNEVSKGVQLVRAKGETTKVPSATNNIIKVANKAMKAVSKIVPDLKIVIHENEDSYLNSTDGRQGNGEYDANTNTIHINAPKQNATTIAHEIFHAVFLNKVRTDEKAAKAAANLMKSIRKSLDSNSDLAKKIDDFAKMYKSEGEGIMEEERLAQLVGILSSEYKKLNKFSKNKVVEFFKKLAEKFGIDLGSDFGSTDKSVIDFLNRFSESVRTGREVTAEELDKIITEPNEQSAASTFKIRQDKSGVDAPKVADDPRDFIRKYVTEVDINEFNGQPFVTCMYDGSTAGDIDLGNGVKLNLFGGRNYVAYNLSLKENGKIGDVSNLAAFNTKANAESFMRNVNASNAGLFAPHVGTTENSWKFQQHIFSELVSAARNNNILTDNELIDLFNSSFNGSNKSDLESFKSFSNSYEKQTGEKLTNLDPFVNDIDKFVSLLDINSPIKSSSDIRRILNGKIVTSKKFQEAIGVNSAKAFIDRLQDPLNKGYSTNDITSIVKFDPNTLVLKETKPNDVDHHPSFGWTVEAKIEGVYQPTKFYKSYDLTDSYTLNNKGGINVSEKAKEGKENFIKKNVTGQTGSIVKVGVMIRNQLTPEKENVTVNVAPFFNTKVETVQDAERLRATPEYQEYKKGLSDIANKLGIPDHSIDEVIGGYVNDAGEDFVEISNTVNLDGVTMDQAEEYAALAAALAPEVQEASIASRFVQDGSEKHNANVYELKVDNVEETAKSMKDVGLSNFSIDDKNGVVKFIDVFDFTDPELQNKIGNLLNSLDQKGINYEQAEYQPVESKYIGAGERNEIFRRAESEGSKTRGSEQDFNNLLEQATQRDKEFQGIEPTNRQQKTEEEKLSDKVEKARERGFSDKRIADLLSARGYSQENIQEALGSKPQPAVPNEELPGKEELMAKVDKMIERQRKKNVDEKKIKSNVDTLIRNSELYKSTTDDKTKELLELEGRNKLGIEERRAPSVGRVLGVLKDLANITRSDKLNIVKNIRELSKTAASKLSAELRMMRKEGNITAYQAAAVISRLNKVNVLNEKSVSNFVNYMEKVFSDAKYAKDLSTAKKIGESLKSASKNIKKDALLRNVASQFLNIDPSLVEDIEKYNDMAARLNAALTGSKIINGQLYQVEPVSVAEMMGYVHDTMEDQKKAIEEQIRQEFEEAKGNLNKEEEEKPKKKTKEENESETMSALKEMHEAYKSVINSILNSDETISKDRKELVKKFLDMDINKMSAKEAAEYIDSIANFVVNRSVAKMADVVARYEQNMKAEEMAKKGFVSKMLRKYFSGLLGRTLADYGYTDNILFDRMFNGINRGIAMRKAFGLTDYVNSVARAKTMMKAITNDYILKFYKTKPNGQDFNTAYNDVERGMVAEFSKTPFDSTDKINEEFNRKKNIIEESIARLENGNKQEKELGKVYREVYNKLLDGSENAGDVRAKADKTNLDAIDYWVNQYEGRYEKFADISESIYNTILGKEDMYTPTRYRLLEDQVLPVDIGEGDSAFNYNSGNIYTEEAGSMKKAIRPEKLPDNRFIDLSFDSKNMTAMRDLLMDTETAVDVRRVKYFLESPAIEKIIPYKADRNLLQGRFELAVQNVRNKGVYIKNPDIRKYVKFANKLSRIGAAQTLGALRQIPIQTLPIIPNTLINTGGRIDMSYFLNKDKVNFLNNIGYGISNRGAESLAMIESMDKMIANIEKSKPEHLAENIAKAREWWMKNLLERPDVYIAKASWLSYYEKSLKKQGIKPDYSDPSKVNKEAADYAESMVSRQQNASMPEFQGRFFSGRSASTNMLWKMLMAFSNFRMNQSARIGTDYSVLTSKTATKEDRKAAAASLVGAGAERVAYGILSTFISTYLKHWARQLLGREDDEETYAEALKKAIKLQSMGAFLDFFSPVPALDTPINYVIEKTGSFVQDIMDVPENDRIEIPAVYDSNFMKNAGMFGIVADRTTDLVKTVAMSLGAKYRDKYGNAKKLNEEDQKTLRWMLLPELLSDLGLAPAEGHIIAKNVLTEAQKKYETPKERQAKAERAIKREENKEQKLSALNVLLSEAPDEEYYREVNKKIEYLTATDERKEELKKEQEAEDELKSQLLTDPNTGIKYDNESELERYNRPLYEQNFGENSEWKRNHRVEEKVEKDMSKKIQMIEDAEYGYSGSSSSSSGSSSGWGSGWGSSKRSSRRSSGWGSGWGSSR